MFSTMFREDFRRAIAAGAVLAVVVGCALALGQGKPEPSTSAAGIEFPVVMRQKVAAGTTPVGTKVQAKLTVATLVNGVVIPQDAILSGEVTESVGKSATDPSRLAIRMDSAQWKNKSAPVELALAPRVYLTAWYYPATSRAAEDPSDGLTPRLPGSRRWDGTGTTVPNSPTSQPFPGHGTDVDQDPKPLPSGVSQHRVLMKNVESTRNADGSVAITSSHFNIKLDKQTTYVLAAGELGGGPS